jgi:hypothetical protein
MTSGDYLANVLLVALVVGQMRGKRLTAFGLLWPVVLVLYLGIKRVHGIPHGGNDLRFALLGAATGAALGIVCGTFTHIFRAQNGKLIGRATGIAAVFWVLGTGCRIAFALYATHGGGPAIARFSATHRLTGEDAWMDTLFFMALAEVVGRTIFLGVRAWAFQRTKPAATEAAA